MRFQPEFTDDANAGLTMMIDMLKSVKDKHPGVSVADIWTLAGAASIEFTGGPKIPFAFGRTDADNKKPAACPAHEIPENGRLPDALQGAAHLRQVFGRMGFNDREIVALSGGHTLGRCHQVRSGFDGPWTEDPLTFNNSYFKNLMNNEWQERNWDGKKQFEDKATQKLMMLPTDIALKQDPVFNPIAREYADHQDVFFKDFAAAFSKLLHLGCANQPIAAPTLEAKERAGLEFREYAMHGSTQRMQKPALIADVHEREADSGRTALHKAAFWGHIQTVTYLLDELKLDPNVTDFSGDTALHDASRFGHKLVIDKLLAAGADPNKKNKAGKSSADLAEEKRTDRIDNTNSKTELSVTPHMDAIKSDIRTALVNQKAFACPMAMRVAWHASGTYDQQSKTGGSDGATMRFQPEFTDDANAGLTMMIDMLKSVKDKHPGVSVADIWTLAGAASIEFTGGPKIPFAFGRTDADNKKPAACPAHEIPENGRLPDALQGAAHLRQVFGRMGFNDREIVALSGGHTLGRCHQVRSGFDGPWTEDPLTFNNSYFKNLMNNEWQERNWDGKKQFEDKATQKLMMLPTDIALKQDPVFNPIAREYADHQDVFFKDFAAAFSKLLHLGCANQPIAAPTLEAKERAGLEFREYAMHGSTQRMQKPALIADVHEREADSGRTALHKAAFWGHIQTVTYLLDELKLDPNVTDFSGDTALHDASRFGHKLVIDKLLAAGADPNKKNKAGKSSADLAEEYGKDPIDGPRLTLAQLNAMSVEAFEAALGGIYENSPWVPRTAATKRPFDSLRALADAMAAAVDGSEEAVKLALLRAHPDLAGKAALAGSVTAHSSDEQARAGLANCTVEELKQFTDLNSAYTEKFGWPFILAVRNATKRAILCAFERRLKNDACAERAECLSQVHKIAYMRLLASVTCAHTGFLTCHVLDTARGCPAAGMRVALRRLNGIVAQTLGTWITNDDGRLGGPALEGAAHRPGTYEWTFYVGEYFAAAGVPTNAGTPFFDEVPIRFGIGDPESHYHVPLLVSPAGCSTYRGS